MHQQKKQQQQRRRRCACAAHSNAAQSVQAIVSFSPACAGARTGDALGGGEVGRARGGQLLGVLGRQLHRAVVQVGRQLQRLAGRQLGRLGCLCAEAL